MATIREVLTKFMFEVDEGAKARVKRSVEELGKSVNKSLAIPDFKKNLEGVSEATDGVGEAFGRLGEAIKPVAWFIAGIGAASAGIFLASKATADYTDQVADTAQAIGVTTDALQSLGYAAQLSGSDFETVANSFRLLANQLQSAKVDPQGQTALMFNKLGVAAMTASGQIRSADKVIYDVANRFSKMKDGAEKTAIATDLFGRAGSKLIPLLNQGAAGIKDLQKEAFALGVVLDEKSIKAGNDFNDSWDRLRMTLTGLRNEIFSSINPLFTEFMDNIVEWVRLNRELLKSRTIEWLKQFGDALKFVWNVGWSVYGLFKNIITQLGGIETALKIMLVAWGAFTTGKILFAISNVILKLAELEIALQTLGKAGLLAQAEILLIPAAFIAAGAALFLIIDDVIGAIEGKKSVTGLVVNTVRRWWASFKGEWPKLTEFLEGVFGWIFKIFNVLSWILPGIAQIRWAMFAMEKLDKMGLLPRGGEADAKDATKDWTPTLPGLAGMSRDAARDSGLLPRIVAPPTSAADQAFQDVKQTNIFQIDAKGMSPNDMFEAMEARGMALISDLKKNTAKDSQRVIKK